MKLSYAYSRVAVRPFPSGKWVYDLMTEVRKKIYRVFESIEDTYETGRIPYNKVIKILGAKFPVWLGMVPEGKSKGLNLAIHLIPRPDESVHGNATVVDRGWIDPPLLKITIYFTAPEVVEEIYDFMDEDKVVTSVMEALHHELVHIQDPKFWKVYRQHQQGGRSYTKSTENLDKYFKQPMEISAYEGSSYPFFVNAKERGLTLEKAIKDYLVNSLSSDYVRSIRGDKKRWREFLTRLYKSADQAFGEI